MVKNVKNVAVAATFEIKPGRYPELDPQGLYSHVTMLALREWGLRPADIDGLLAAPSGQVSNNVDVTTHERLASEFGLRPRFADTLWAGGSSFAIMVLRAIAAIECGQAEAVLCVGTGKFTKQGAGNAERIARMSAEPDFEMPYGPFVPALYALIASQFMARRGISSEDLARVAVSARRWAQLNPQALMHNRGDLTIEDVLNSRMVAEPFHYLDCSVPVDGGGALLVTTGDRAKSLHAQPAYIHGFGEVHLHSSLSEAGSNLIDTGASITGPQALSRAGVGVDGIDLVQLYDAFSATPLILLENLGFCAKGESGAFVQSGATDPGGILPMNTGGGLLSFGHTGEASGMSVLLEGVRQVMGCAGANQVPAAETALVHVYGGMMYEHATMIIGRSS